MLRPRNLIEYMQDTQFKNNSVKTYKKETYGMNEKVEVRYIHRLVLQPCEGNSSEGLNWVVDG